MKYLIIFILTAGCVKSEYDFVIAPPGLTSAIYEQLKDKVRANGNGSHD